MSYHMAWVDGHGYARVPELQILELDPSHTCRPCRGYSSTLAVESADAKIVGWIGTPDLGYETVREWMIGTNYIPIDDRPYPGEQP